MSIGEARGEDEMDEDENTRRRHCMAQRRDDRTAQYNKVSDCKNSGSLTVLI